MLPSSVTFCFFTFQCCQLKLKYCERRSVLKFYVSQQLNNKYRVSTQLRRIIITMQRDLTPLQENVLEKYRILSQSLQSLDNTIRELNNTKEDRTNASPEAVLQEMRDIEIKLGLVGTLLKGSVYSLILQKKNELALAKDSPSV
ncbi:hypothetical protein NCAS_0D03390 [Naumovozyma castellii]|uniref:DASH complex subunit DAD3 n=1 Tax=Naumovozyma castellii TaxID=27288 RepID=G0VEC9_NAUCA|nr:hypothetical protein NCAS_0D03390 [Naumovozyma castellii CBS 4309]CCC69920.1 hypothetical protein NCAS_0D03390 [Naumovozyma castellii CBS 4309]